MIQELLVAASLVAAGGYIVWKKVPPGRSSASCESGCGKCPVTRIPVPESTRAPR